MNMQLRTKLLIGFVAVALIGSVIGGVGIYGIRNITEADTKLYEKITVPMSQLVTITESFQRIRINIRDHIDAATPELRKGFDDKIKELQAEFRSTTTAFSTSILTDVGREQFALLMKAADAYDVDLAKVIALDEANKDAEARGLMQGSAKATALAVQAEIDKLVASKNALAKATSDGNTELANTMTLIMLITMFGGLGISIFLAIWLGVFMVSRPLMKISETLGSGSSQIGTASNQLSSASQEIANGTTEQASSIEETSSSMEELSSMVKQNVANAKEASILADKAAESSQVGYGQMEKMLDSMNEINKSSDKIKKIIKVIDDIAFQTNILALNAAVEAARAGEAGMGFAVVADEVKNLANRSADAAKETADMIEDSLHKTSQGLDIAVKMSEVFKDILTTAKKVSEMAREVESASRQQDTGIEQVNQAIVQFDEVVQTNAASAEETASAAEELQSQVENLNDVVATLLKLVTGKETAKIERLAARQPVERSPKPVHQLTHKPTAAPRKVQGSRSAVPEQMIPFDDDDDLKSL